MKQIIVVHHTVSSRDKTKVKDIDDWHQIRWPNFKSSLGYFVGYHFVITGDGTLTQTRRMSEQGAHCPPNKGRIGVVLTGNFEEEKPSKAQLTSLQNLLEKLNKQGITEIYGHNHFSKTLCPGRHLSKWIKMYKKISIIKKLINLYKKLYKKLLGLKK